MIEIEEKFYSYVSHRYIVRYKCNICGNSEEISVEKEKDISNIKCSRCEVKKVNESLYDRYNIESKLYDLYLRLKRKYKLCREWEEDYEKFRSWALENGYRHWKKLGITDKNEELSSGNCYWRLEEIVSKKIKTDNSLKSNVSNLKILMSLLENMNTDIESIKEILSILIDSDKLNSNLGIKGALKEINKIMHSKELIDKYLENIDVKVGD